MKRRQTVIAIAAVLVASVLAWEFIPIMVQIGDGSFDLTVRVECPEGRPRSVTCAAFGSRLDAEEAVVHHLRPEEQLWPTVADSFDGEPLTVRVPMSTRESPFGRQIRWSQYRYLAITAKLADGRRVSKVVDIPDGRVSRAISVALP